LSRPGLKFHAADADNTAVRPVNVPRPSSLVPGTVLLVVLLLASKIWRALM